MCGVCVYMSIHKAKVSLRPKIVSVKVFFYPLVRLHASDPVPSLTAIILKQQLIQQKKNDKCTHFALNPGAAEHVRLKLRLHCTQLRRGQQLMNSVLILIGL